MLSIVAFPFFLCAMICKLFSAIWQKISIILSMLVSTLLIYGILGLINNIYTYPESLPSFFILIGFIAVAFVAGGVATAIVFLLFAYSVKITMYIYIFLQGISESLYSIFYELFLMLYHSAEQDYEYIKLTNPKKYNPLFCLFYTILFFFKKSIWIIFSSALPISFVLSIATVICSLVFWNSRISHAFGINLIQFLSHFSPLELARDIIFFALCLFTIIITLTALGTELYEWARDLNMSLDERNRQLENISSLSFSEDTEYQESNEKNKVDIDKVIQHLKQAEPIVTQARQLLERSNDELLNNSLTIYMANLNEIVTTINKFEKKIPTVKHQELIINIKRLDKQKKDLETMIKKVQKQLENPTVSSIFFNGCNSLDKLDKRYKTLCKAYHPDGESGNEETFKKMKTEYETLKQQFI